MKPETKLWHELKRITPKISWTRIENTSGFGTPDLLGYANSGYFFTVELKITHNNRVRFSPHQIAFHVRHPKHSFILTKEPSQDSFKLFSGHQILDLKSKGTKSLDACALGLVACGLYLENLN
tara:strand:- start:289 stop:657 length:369 start_codon:yes stop_codon:yes gene_type:complete